MNGHDGAAAVVFAGEQHGGFETFEQFAVGFQIALDIGQNLFALARQLEQGIEIVGHGADVIVVGDGLFQALAHLHHFLAFFGLAPEIGGGDLVFGFG